MPLRLVRRKATNNWHIKGTIAGQRIRESTGTSDKVQAEAIRIRRETEIWNRHLHGPQAVATFPEALNIYLDRGGEERFVVRLLEHFRQTPLADIDQAAVERAASRLYPGAKPSTINRQLITPLSAIMNVGWECGLCQKPSFRRRKVKPPVRRAVSPEWLNAVLDETSPHLSALLVFMAFSGCRISEAIRLTWADVDLTDATAVIHQTKTRPRVAALPPTVVAAMASIPSKRQPSARVFRYVNRSSPIDALNSACDRAEVERHSLHEIGRHTFATWMLKQGETLADVADAGGWKSIALVKDIYGHLERSRTDAAVRSLDSRLARNWHSDDDDEEQVADAK